MFFLDGHYQLAVVLLLSHREPHLCSAFHVHRDSWSIPILNVRREYTAFCLDAHLL